MKTEMLQENEIDYSQIYRNQELRQLKKRLRTTKFILVICSFITLAGGLIFWILPDNLFSTKNFLIYTGISVLFYIYSLLSRKKPYLSLIAALGTCLAFWFTEVIIGKSDVLIIESSIQKLFIVSLLVIGIPFSREAELIRKELHFA